MWYECTVCSTYTVWLKPSVNSVHRVVRGFNVWFWQYSDITATCPINVHHLCLLYDSFSIYLSAINYRFNVHLVSALVLGDLVTSGHSRPGINMHLKNISTDQLDSFLDGMIFFFITYYFSVLMHNDVKQTENLFAQAFPLFIDHHF